MRERTAFGGITGVSPREWPFYHGLGNKFGPDRGVSGVGSFGGVLRIDFAEPSRAPLPRGARCAPSGRSA